MMALGMGKGNDPVTPGTEYTPITVINKDVRHQGP